MAHLNTSGPVRQEWLVVSTLKNVKVNVCHQQKVTGDKKTTKSRKKEAENHMSTD
jgi:hypothetical protein